MRRFIKINALLLGLFLPVLYACAQTPPPPAGPATPGGPPPPPATPPARPLQRLTKTSGTLQAYSTNDRNEYDAFSLQNSGETMVVRFPPTMAAQLMAVAKPGASITIQGFYESSPEGQNAFHLVNATVAGQTIYDSPPAQPATPPVETAQTFNGTISELHKDAQGRPNGLVLGGNQLIDLPPGTYDQLQSFLKPGSSIAGAGIRVSPPAGVVLARNIILIHPQTLTLNGQTYMVR